VFLTEVFLEYIGFFHIIQQRKPIDDLGEPMLKARAPFRYAPTGFLENAFVLTVLKLDKAKVSGGLVTDDQIRGKVAENRIFKDNIGRGANMSSAGTQVRG
jgi:hypothetical protein